MTPKRAFDLAVLVLMSIFVLPAMLVIFIIFLLIEKRPFIYVSERMNGLDSSFKLYKFRTMKTVIASQVEGVTSGNEANRITRFGAFLRKSRLDELPQLYNIARGDLSFVGPRPSVRQYIEKYPDVYKEVLEMKPGVTGLATLAMHGYEDRVLKLAKSTDDANRIYETQCIPKKIKIELLYKKHSSLCFDFILIWRTIVNLFFPKH